MGAWLGVAGVGEWAVGWVVVWDWGATCYGRSDCYLDVPATGRDGGSGTARGQSRCGQGTRGVAAHSRAHTQPGLACRRVKRYDGMTGRFLSKFGGAGVFGETVAISADARKGHCTPSQACPGWPGAPGQSPTQSSGCRMVLLWGPYRRCGGEHAPTPLSNGRARSAAGVAGVPLTASLALWPPCSLTVGGVYVLDVNGTSQAPPAKRGRRALLQGGPKPTMRIQKFVSATGQQLVAFASYGTGLGQMADPFGITSTRNGFEVRGLAQNMLQSAPEREAARGVEVHAGAGERQGREAG